MPPRRYEIVSIRPTACELLVRYVEADHEITLNLTPPVTAKDLHRHVLRHWPRQQFTTMRILKDLVDAKLPKEVRISAAEVEIFGLEDIDE
jgi:hypothetical protein